MTTYTTNTSTNPNKPVEPVLRIDGKAFDKFVYMRDYRPCEVAMFGITKADNPLHVYDFELVKQVVNSVSADCDKDYMADFVAANLAKGIAPINCERIWCHTHPMTGESSANPSGKDMSTWNDPDNSYKNFLVMMILSKSGQITCKLRIRSNWNKEVSGLNLPFEFEKDIKVEIVKDQSYTDNINAAIARKFGEQAVTALGTDSLKALIPYMNLLDIYPEFEQLHKQYEELVSKEESYTNHNRIGYQGNHQNSWLGGHGGGANSKKKQKKEASAKNVPEMLLMISEHKETFNPISDLDLKKIQESFDGINDVTDLAFLEDEFKQDNPRKTKDYISTIIGAISGDILDFDDSTSSLYIKFKSNDFDKRAAACNGAGMTYPLFKEAAVEINVMRGVK